MNILKSILKGIMSIFTPNAPIKPKLMNTKSSSENISNDWKRVGNYIRKSYDQESARR